MIIQNAKPDSFFNWLFDDVRGIILCSEIDTFDLFVQERTYYFCISFYQTLRYNNFFFIFPGIFEVPRGLETVFSPFERKTRRS